MKHDLTLLGATGFTGRKIAARLLADGQRPRLAGRNLKRLQSLAAELGAPDLPLLEVDAADASAMAELGASTRVCVSAAGPFVKLGPGTLEACLAGGAHVLDLTGEEAWVRSAQARDAEAKARGITVAPSFAFESAIADFAASVAVEELEQVERVDVTYFMDAFPSSTGTKRSVVPALASPPPGSKPFQVRREAWPWSADAPRARATLWRVSYPGAEVPTIAWHAPPGARVTMLFALPSALGGLLKLTLRPAMWALRWGGAWIARPFLGFSRRGPSEAALAKSRFTVVVSAQGQGPAGPATRTAFVEGQNPYGLTADLVTHAARAMLAAGYDHSGVRSPSQVIDARQTLDALGLSLRVEQEVTPCPVRS